MQIKNYKDFWWYFGECMQFFWLLENAERKQDNEWEKGEEYFSYNYIFVKEAFKQPGNWQILFISKNLSNHVICQL